MLRRYFYILLLVTICIGNQDYQRKDYNVTIPAGERAIQLHIDIIDDDIVEITEYYDLKIIDTLPEGVTLVPSYAVTRLNIQDEDSKFNLLLIIHYSCSVIK